MEVLSPFTGLVPRVIPLTVNVPWQLTGPREVVIQQALSGITPSSMIIASVAPHLDTDENDPELLEIQSINVTPGTDQVTIAMGFRTVECGPIKLFLQVYN